MGRRGSTAHLNGSEVSSALFAIALTIVLLAGVGSLLFVALVLLHAFPLSALVRFDALPLVPLRRFSI
jgi:hypothetical protein